MDEVKTYTLVEDARTYYYPDMRLRIEGGVHLVRREVPGGKLDEVFSAMGSVVTIHAGWQGVTQERDEAPPSQIDVTPQKEEDHGCLQEDGYNL